MSTARRRIKRYRRKYVTEALVKRAKKLLPFMYTHLRIDLINWDFLEYLLFPIYDELGIPEELRPFYTAWAKRKAELGLKFSEATQLEEYAILMTEFEIRGLDSAILEALEPWVDEWVNLSKGLPSNIIDLTVDAVLWGIDTTPPNWRGVGSTPYLNLDDGDTNKIYSPSDDRACAFSLEDTTRDGSPQDVVAYWKAKKIGALNVGMGVSINTPTDIAWIFAGALTNTDYEERATHTDIYGLPLKNYLTSKAIIDASDMRFFTYSGFPSQAHITYAHLKLVY